MPHVLPRAAALRAALSRQRQVLAIAARRILDASHYSDSSSARLEPLEPWHPWNLFVCCASNRPGARSQGDCARRRSWQVLFDSSRQLGAAFLVERRHVRRSRTCSPKQRSPVVVEAGELGGNVNRLALHIAQTARGKEIHERGRMTEREASSFVERRRGGIERNRRIPETSQELHAVSVVPDARRH